MRNKVVTRFAPSPTGLFHIGSARTALFNYLFAKNQGGEMVLRFEDTDKERSEKKYEKDILNGLDWLGIEYSEVFKQSERTKVYEKYIEKLLKEDKAYISKEEEGERGEVIRFKNPNVKVKFNDLIRGEVEFDTTEQKDFVIAKSKTEPLYNLAVVIDDNDMGVTHVIRGEDHISNTPRQILILEALGFERPIYAHLPLILGEDRSKLSKRHGAVSVNEYKKDYLPEALVNYLVLLGWNPGNDREIFTMEELIKEFSLEKVQKGGAVFNIEKLDWVNKQYIEKLSNEEFLSLTDIPFKNEIIISLIKERTHKFSDVKEITNEFDFVNTSPEYTKEGLLWKDETPEATKEILMKVISLIEDSPDIKESIQPYADEQGRGNVLHPMRYALTGKDKSPDPFTVANIIGKEETLKRLNKAIDKLS